jgi:iron complex outermembrane receptor protein
MHRPVLFLVRSGVCAVLASAAASSALAAEQSTDNELISEVVVTGTRVADRSRLDTLAPVDVLPAESLSRQGTTELAQALSTAAPSLNFPRPAISDGSDHIRPATLRGLAPDQTLVLVNSKRRHQSALVNVNGSIGRGSAAVDLNAIPLAAIERVEVLRDGASAQYGSDAIAGVVNLQLRQADSGGNATATYGEYRTDVDTARQSHSASDGATLTASAWSGFGLGSDGFLTLSAEYRDRDPTSRGDIDPRVTPARVTSRYGDSKVEDQTLYVNAGVPVNDTWNLYGWAGYQQREGQSAANFRPVNNSGNVITIYPNGFLPYITTEVDDLTAAAGVKGMLAGWDTDISLVYGSNQVDYGVENSVNATFGAASQTSFKAGVMEYDQLVFNLGLVRTTNLGSLPLNVAWGVEARRETYAIEAGEFASYATGPITVSGTTPIPPGAQGFPGFRPNNQVDEDRTAYSIYVDLESQMTEQFLTSIAVRAEDYSDFGSAVTGKLSARFDFNEAFALRGTLASGFRAPGLQQEYFTATSTNFIAGVPFEIGTFPATSSTARSLGAKDLDAEESMNYSLGAVFRSDGFEATIDAYRIDIDDRIVLSENLNSPEVQALITPLGAARFFINGVDTTTEGVDVVLRQRWQTESAGKFDLTLSGNYNTTEVTKVPTTAVLSTLPVPPVLFGTINVRTFEDGTPSEKLAVAIDWSTNASFGSIGATARATYYGEVIEPSATPGSTVITDINLGSHTLVDLALRTDVGERLGFALGVDNAFDAYPNQTPAFLNTTGSLGFSRYSPFGFNGRFFYGRVSFSW